jgi:hypothetical protein
MTRKAVFSEGRTPCVRMVWPNVCRGIPFSRHGRAGPGRPRGHARVEPIPFLRACGARPSAGGPSRLGWPCGEKPGIPRRAVFSEGRGLRARTVRPDECKALRCHRCLYEKPVAKRGQSWVSRNAFLAGVRSPARRGTGFSLRGRVASPPLLFPFFLCSQGPTRPQAMTWPLSLAMASSLAILSSMGGCVLKSLAIPPPERGFTMNMWEVAGFASMGIC